MKILFDLNGWARVVDVPFHSIDSGIIEVDIYPPMGNFVDVPGCTTNVAVRVIFRHDGGYKAGMPIFKYEVVANQNKIQA